MLCAIFWVSVGCLIGWHVPQPLWAKNIQDKFVAWFKTLTQ
jgi:hypothetical protein